MMHKANSKKKRKEKGYLHSRKIEILASLVSFYFLYFIIPLVYLGMQQGFPSARKFFSSERI